MQFNFVFFVVICLCSDCLSNLGRAELFTNIQSGVLKLPVSMSREAKDLIVHLLNRNPSKRLGAGAAGAEDIKRHVFFADTDWDLVRSRGI